MYSLPKVMLVGGPDIDARLEIMDQLKGNFDICALGSHPALHDTFAARGFDYTTYHLSRRVNPFSDLYSVAQLVSIFRRIKPQIVHAFDTEPGIWGCLSARLAGVPVVIGTITGMGSLYGSRNLRTRLIWNIYQTLQKITCHFSDLTIFQNHVDARQFITTGVVSDRKIVVIPGSGVATDKFDPARIPDAERGRLRDDLGILSGEIVVTMVSRLIRSKGVLDFVSASQQISALVPGVRFLLVGPQDYESVDRISDVELNQLNQAVIWPGSRKDIPVVLAISDIFVLPSAYREGIPRVLLEAASMNLPIVTTDSPGCNEVVIDGENGFYVPVHDPVALSQAILQLLEKPDLREKFGRMSRRRAVEDFDLSIVAAQTRSVYWQLLSRSASQSVMNN